MWWHMATRVKLLEKMEHYYNNIHGWFTFQDLYSEMVEKFPDGSHFVELGSWQGKSAVFMGVEIVNSNKDIKFDCIDNWLFEGEIYSRNSEYMKMKHNAFNMFLKNIEPLSKVINYHKMDSVEASKLYDDESLEFVYVDASHYYENVKNDLTYWYPKVKSGGVIAGHDYQYAGVKLAVDEFFTGKIMKTPETSWVYYKNNLI